MQYDDELIRALRRKFAPDIMTAIRDASTMELIAPSRSVNVPLQADAAVSYEKDLAAFIVKGTIRGSFRDKWMGSECLFSTREMESARDKAEVINYLFESAKDQFIRALVDGELKKILKEE
jgi:hypothetical protein